MGFTLSNGSPTRSFVAWVCSLIIMVFFASACGGGGSSHGSSSSKFGDGISLVSIDFPKSVDLKEYYDSPPQAAPLSQQIVFTFSGPVQGPVDASSILIYSEVGLDYDGPQVLFDPVKNLLLAKGTFQFHANMVVFTPQLPKTTMQLNKVNSCPFAMQ